MPKSNLVNDETTKTQNPFLSVAAPHSIKKVPRDSFSRASHFAGILLPVILGAAYAWMNGLAAAQNPFLKTLFTGPMAIPLSQDQSLLFRFLLFGALLIGLGSAVILLRFIEKLEEWEINQSSRAKIETNL